jgi:hypothetical protein
VIVRSVAEKHIGVIIMRTCIVLILVFSLTIVSFNNALAQTPADKEQEVEKIVVGTNEVVLMPLSKTRKDMR